MIDRAELHRIWDEFAERVGPIEDAYNEGHAKGYEEGYTEGWNAARMSQ